MKTETFISALAADRIIATRPAVALSIAASIGFAVAAAGFLLALGVRPDAAAALGTLRFPFKFAVTLALFAAGARLALALATPGADVGKPARLFAVPALLLAGAVAIELMAVPVGAWAARLVGTNARVCLVAIPALALGPLAAVLLALRSAAPTAPLRAGAAAGLVAAAIAATLYASHCIDDSPLFVAVWYSLATAVVVAAGAWLGPRVLRW